MRQPLDDLPDDALRAVLEALAIAVTADRVVEFVELKHYESLLDEVFPDADVAATLSVDVFQSVSRLGQPDFNRRIAELAEHIPSRCHAEVFRRVVRISAADGSIVPAENNVIARFAEVFDLDEDTAAYLLEAES
jgi:uncharacterized tellurite resistance protein B-like protein